MVDYIEAKTGKQGKILIEVTDNRSKVGFGQGEPLQPKLQADNAFNQAMEAIQLTAHGVLEALEALEKKPDHVKIDFAVKIDPLAGAMLAKANSSDAQLKISLGWENTPPDKGKEEKTAPA